MKLRKGNVFTSVCQEFCLQGVGVHTPRADTPPGRHPPGQTPPPLSRHPLPWADTSSWQTPSPPGRQLLPRTVGILLECILVNTNSFINHSTCHCSRNGPPHSITRSFTLHEAQARLSNDTAW